MRPYKRNHSTEIPTDELPTDGSASFNKKVQANLPQKKQADQEEQDLKEFQAFLAAREAHLIATGVIEAPLTPEQEAQLKLETMEKLAAMPVDPALVARQEAIDNYRASMPTPAQQLNSQIEAAQERQLKEEANNYFVEHGLPQNVAQIATRQKELEIKAGVAKENKVLSRVS